MPTYIVWTVVSENRHQYRPLNSIK